MARSAPSKLANLRELVGLLSTSVQVQAEIADILEDYEIRMYSLEEDRKRLLQHCRDLDNKCHSLDKRYSELLYKFSEVRQSSK